MRHCRRLWMERDIFRIASRRTVLQLWNAYIYFIWIRMLFIMNMSDPSNISAQLGVSNAESIHCHFVDLLCTLRGYFAQ